jgi:hypothetical protein
MNARAATAVLLVLAATYLDGCGGSRPPPPPTPTVTLSPTATLQEGFAISVTGVVSATPKPRPSATPKPFHPPTGPYIRVIPASGPPESRTLQVLGGHLPPRATIQLVWAATTGTSSIGTYAGTTATGTLATRFSVPAAPPGVYRVIAEINAVPYASANYTVKSKATLSVSVYGSAPDVRLIVRGSHFVPRITILLVVYPLVKKGEPIMLGRTQSGKRGTISLVRSSRRLVIGQYLVRAFSASASAAQTAQAFFDIVE